MNKFQYYCVIAFLLVFQFLFLAPDAVRAFSRTVRVTSFIPEEGDVRDFYIVYGEIVEVGGYVNGDIYAVGNEVIIDADVDGDVLAVASDIKLSGKVSQDVRLVGSLVELNGEIGRNVTVIAFDLVSKELAKIEGGLAAFCGTIVLDSPIAGRVELLANEVELSNYFGSGVEVRSDLIRLNSNTYIEGDLIYYASNEVEIDEGVAVIGSISRGSYPDFENYADYSMEEIFPELKTIRLGLRVFSFLTALIISFMLIRLAPRYMDVFPKVISGESLKVLIIGVFTLVWVPIVGVLLLITIFGIPVALMILLVYSISVFFSKIYFSLWLGLGFVRKVGIHSRYWAVLSGLVTYYLLRLVPTLGLLVGFFSLILGMGAIVVGNYRWYKKHQVLELFK